MQRLKQIFKAIDSWTFGWFDPKTVKAACSADHIPDSRKKVKPKLDKILARAQELQNRWAMSDTARKIQILTVAVFVAIC